MKKYKCKLTEIELIRLNMIENEDIRCSCMSVLSYLIKKNNDMNEGWSMLNMMHKKPNKYELKVSFKRLLKAYNRSHTKISITTLKNRIDMLEEFGLIYIDKTNKTNIYTFLRYASTENNKNTEEKPSQPVENSTIDAPTDEHKYININKTKDIDSYSNTNNFNFDNYINHEEKIDNWEYAKNLLNEAFKMLNVKSTYIKNTVISKMYDYYRNVTKKHAMKYIFNCITNAREQSKHTWNKAIQGTTIPKNNEWNGYTSRRDYQYYSALLNNL